jgi:hypothetical protein
MRKTKKRPILILDFHSETNLVKVAFATNTAKYKINIFEFYGSNKSILYKFNKTDVA